MENKKFIIDKQTLEDLNIMGRYKPGSIFSLFLELQTRGGERYLEQIFNDPMTDAKSINARAEQFEYFKGVEAQFPVPDEMFQATEEYLSNAEGAGMVVAMINGLRRKVLELVARDKEFGLLAEGMRQTMQAVVRIREFINLLKNKDNGGACRDMVEEADKIVNGDMKWLTAQLASKKLGLGDILMCDYRLRHKCIEQMQQLIKLMYKFDVMLCVGTIARRRGFTKAVALEGDNHILKMEGVYHPSLKKAIANDILIDREKNVFFLTGANMAGKSTLMKSIGVATYMAHIGLPVAASKMEFAPIDGMFSSINVSDNMNMGYSHFYAEVVRVKTVAETVAKGYRLLVIFDELFKGTNVKDAFDATIAVTLGFSQYRRCSFIISTHITEAGHDLKTKMENIQYHYVPTVMEGSIPRYTYKLTDGITNDRHGMMIIQNEKIIETIKNER